MPQRKPMIFLRLVREEVARPLGEVERDAQPVAFGCAGKHLVPKPALPEQQEPGPGLDRDERLQLRRSVLPACGRGHHRRQTRVFEADSAGTRWYFDVQRAGNDAVRVDVST